MKKWMCIGASLFLLWVAFLLAAVRAQTPPVSHWEYVVTDGNVYVYDIDNAGALVKKVSSVIPGQPRGAAASAVTGRMYVAYGSDSSSGSLLAYDLSTDKVVWTKNYSHGIDSHAITPDATKIFMPSGERSSGSTWWIEDPANGNDVGSIVAASGGTGTGTGPHNTIVNNSGTKVYMGLRDFNLGSSTQGQNDFAAASVATSQVTLHVTPTKSGVRPFTIDSKETLVYFAVTGFIGFQVGDLSTGKVLYTVAVDGSGIPGYTLNSSVTCPSHGIALSDDDKTLYLIDQPNSYVHVFDVSGVPASAPVQVANIALPDKITGTQTECGYDCEKDSWLNLSHDGRYLFVGDTQDVISTATLAVAMRMPMIANTRIFIEVDMQGTTPVWAMGSRFSYGGSGSVTGAARPQPPTGVTAAVT